MPIIAGKVARPDYGERRADGDPKVDLRMLCDIHEALIVDAENHRRAARDGRRGGRR